MVVIDHTFTVAIKNLNMSTKIFNNGKGVIQLYASSAFIPEF